MAEKPKMKLGLNLSPNYARLRLFEGIAVILQNGRFAGKLRIPMLRSLACEVLKRTDSPSYFVLEEFIEEFQLRYVSLWSSAEEACRCLYDSWGDQ